MTDDAAQVPIPEDLRKLRNQIGDYIIKKHSLGAISLVDRLIDRLVKAEQELRDEALAFNHANEIVGKQEQELAALRKRLEAMSGKVTAVESKGFSTFTLKEVNALIANRAKGE